MKPVTRELGAGIVPARMLEDGQLPSAAFVMFSALTLYAEPGGDWDEWELDFGNRGGMSAGTKAVCGNKAMMDKLATGGYIEELVWDGEVALFSFPDWVKELLRGGSNAEVSIGETRPEAKAEEETAEDAGGDGDEAQGREVGRSAPPEGYTPKVFNGRSGAPECSECGKKIEKGEEYFWKGAGPRSPKVCKGCAPAEEENKAPLTPDPAPPEGEVGNELPAQADTDHSFYEAKRVLGEKIDSLEKGIKGIFREALEEYAAEKGEHPSVADLTSAAMSSLEAERTMRDRIAESIDKLLAAQHTRHEGGSTVAELEELVRDQELIETALGVQITKRLNETGNLQGDALKIIETTSLTIGEFLAHRSIVFSRGGPFAPNAEGQG